MEAYAADVERTVRLFYESLSEKDRRRYAAVEAARLGHGGVEYVAGVLGCDPKTVRQGRAELATLPADPAGGGGVAVPGDGGGGIGGPGGDAAAVVSSSSSSSPVVDPLDAAFLSVVNDRTAGDPMRAGVRWTNLSARQIAKRLAAAGFAVGRRAVRRLLRRHRYGRRKLSKVVVMGDRPGRDAQFLNIARLKAEYLAAGDPAVSIDTKKRELIGDFSRPGTAYATGPVGVFDHDVPSFADGVVIPHGVYDLARNAGHVTLGTSHDTSAFACDSLRLWWARQGRAAYPDAKRLLVLCDGGGSNSATRHLFKHELQRLADELGIEIRVAHYPPYCSKYNPIEHRLFAHVTRACAGVVFKSVGLVERLVSRTSTSTGLSVTVDVLDQVYETGLKVAADVKRTMRIVFDDVLPKWNYTAMPTGG